MIYPQTLYNFGKVCEDSKVIGDVVRALCGQKVELSPWAKTFYDMIANDNEWMNERIEAQRERWKDRQRKSREEAKAKAKREDVTHCHGDKRDVTVTKRDRGGVTVTNECHGDKRDVTIPTSLPSSLPSSLPTHSKECVDNTRTRGDIPGEKEVMTAATSSMGIPDWYARWWYAEMGRRDWLKTDGKPIGNGNWRPTLMSWWNRETEQRKGEIMQEAKAEAKAKSKVRNLTEEDWILCQERCAMWQDGRCKAGKVVPPALRPTPVPPEECDGFKQVN